MQGKNWRELAARAAIEQDPNKLLEIVNELNEVLERQQRRERNVRTLPSGKRILFVDDEESIRLTLPPVLQERGFRVTAAASVHEAEDLIKAQDFDVLLCDLNIDREGDGFKVLEAIREINPNCVAIFITAYPGLESAQHAIQTDIDGYVTKPADIDELVGLIERKLLARRIQANGASSSSL